MAGSSSVLVLAVCMYRSMGSSGSRCLVITGHGVDVLHGIRVRGHHIYYSILNANHMANGAITNIGF